MLTCRDAYMVKNMTPDIADWFKLLSTRPSRTESVNELQIGWSVHQASAFLKGSASLFSRTKKPGDGLGECRVYVPIWFVASRRAAAIA